MERPTKALGALLRGQTSTTTARAAEQDSSEASSFVMANHLSKRPAATTNPESSGRPTKRAKRAAAPTGPRLSARLVKGLLEELDKASSKTVARVETEEEDGAQRADASVLDASSSEGDLTAFAKSCSPAALDACADLLRCLVRETIVRAVSSATVERRSRGSNAEVSVADLAPTDLLRVFPKILRDF